MKELSIEEKAKAYDEALAKLKRYEGSPTLWSYDDMCEKFFPELKESEDERIRKALTNGFNKLDKSAVWYNGITNGQILAWLEKQGEQPQGKSALEAAKEVKVDNQNCVKPTDKVEPKFHEGEWVFIEEFKGYKNGPFQIKTVDSFGYSFDEYYTIPFMYEDLLSKWTIQDAKDGDVLVSDYEGGICITILKFVVSGNEIEMYCHLVNSELFIAQSGFSNATWHPANREQRDTLMKAIADAGYTFDFEKKELKKIELRQEELTEFEKAVKQVMEEAIECGDTHNLKADADMLLRLAQKPAWSEEDKGMLLEVKCLVDTLRSDGNPDYSVEELQEMWDWLDTIWQKVEYPQPKQEWSEEDEKHLNGVINYIAFSDHPDDFEVWIDWLKSLKPQNRWKPSDEQMNALNDVISSRDIKYDVLSELWKDLKKL